MKIEFNYNDVQFVVDPAKHQILINGQIADGIYAPIGGIIVDVNDEDPEVCKVITDMDEHSLEKIIVYGAPLRISDKVIILGQYVIPADIFVRNDLEEDYGYWSEQLKQKAEQATAQLAASASLALAEVDTAKQSALNDINTTRQSTLNNINTARQSALAEVDTARQSAIAAVKTEADKAKQYADEIAKVIGDVNSILDTINGEVI